MAKRGWQQGDPIGPFFAYWVYFQGDQIGRLFVYRRFLIIQVAPNFLATFAAEKVKKLF
jgi:hypothetical protein